MAKKYRIQQLQADETLLTLHPETDASIVLVDSEDANITATNVQAAIKELKGEIKTTADEVKDGVVTGVKGSAESTYRKGQVEITKANIGLGNVDNTSDLDKPISTAVQAALDNVIQVAEGKTKTYVISASVNLPFASNEDTIKLSMQGTTITTTTGQTSIRLLDLKLGDIVLLTDTDYPDRWVSVINGDLMWFDKLETRKIDLSGYATTTDIDNIKDGTTVVKKAEQDSEGNVIKDTYLPLSGGTMTGQIRSSNSLALIHPGPSIGFGFETVTDTVYGPSYFTRITTTSRALYVKGTGTGTGAVAYKFTFPEKDGTVALVSDLDSYLPLSGGTMTGNISSANELALRHPGAPVGFGLTSIDSGHGASVYTLLTTNAQALYVKNTGTGAVAYKFTFPTKDGTVALVSDLDNYLQLDDNGVMIGELNMGSNPISWYGGYGKIHIGTNKGLIVSTPAGTGLIHHDTTNNVDYTYTFPETSGTIALTSNTNGTYSAVQVTNGIVTAGANMIEIGATGVTTPSANLASGGIFFQEI